MYLKHSVCLELVHCARNIWYCYLKKQQHYLGMIIIKGIQEKIKTNFIMVKSRLRGIVDWQMASPKRHLNYPCTYHHLYHQSSRWMSIPWNSRNDSSLHIKISIWLIEMVTWEMSYVQTHGGSRRTKQQGVKMIWVRGLSEGHRHNRNLDAVLFHSPPHH